MTHALFVELTGDALTNGHLFDGLMATDELDEPLTDMLGRKVEIKRAELDDYLANTRAAIESTRTESGELVGLPIDARDHDKGDGAGYIVGVERVGDLIRLLPRWTVTGIELIKNGIRRWFSATLDTENRVLLGGTLTNWPASREKDGRLLLRPIELASGLYALQEESIDKKQARILQAWDDRFGPEQAVATGGYVVETFDNYIVVRYDGKMYRCAYSENNDGEISFAPRNEWVEVKQSYVEAMRRIARELLARAFGNQTDDDDDVLEHGRAGGKTMTIKLSELTDEQRAQLLGEARAAVLAELGPPDDADEGAADDAVARLREQLNATALADVADLGQAREALLTQMQTALKGEYERMQANAGRMLAEMMSEIKREQHIAEFSAQVTGGSDEHPVGLPVQQEEVERFLAMLDDAQRREAESILERTVKRGLIEFGEHGHGREMKGTANLQPEVARQLAAHLEAGGDAESFFAAAGDILGDMADYDLSKFTETNNG